MAQMVSYQNHKEVIFHSINEAVYFAYTAPKLSISSASEQEGEGWAGPKLKTFLEKTYKGAWQEEARKIEEFAEKIEQDLPFITVPSRKRAPARSGATIRPLQASRGDFKNAFWRQSRTEKIGEAEVVTLVFAATVSCGVSTNEIYWSMAALLALANKVEERGRSVEIWGLSQSHNSYTDRMGERIGINLKKAGEIFDLANLAASTSPAFGRRLCFSLMEKLGQCASGYGTPAGQKDYENGAKDFFKRYGVTVSDCMIFSPCGFWGTRSITDEKSAIAWVTDQIIALEENLIGGVE